MLVNAPSSSSVLAPSILLTSSACLWGAAVAPHAHPCWIINKHPAGVIWPPPRQPLTVPLELCVLNQKQPKLKSYSALPDADGTAAVAWVQWHQAFSTQRWYCGLTTEIMQKGLGWNWREETELVWLMSFDTYYKLLKDLMEELGWPGEKSLGLRGTQG